MSRVLQQASIDVITVPECAALLAPTTSWTVSDNNICVFQEGRGTCNVRITNMILSSNMIFVIYFIALT